MGVGGDTVLLSLGQAAENEKQDKHLRKKIFRKSQEMNFFIGGKCEACTVSEPRCLQIIVRFSENWTYAISAFIRFSFSGNFGAQV